MDRYFKVFLNEKGNNEIIVTDAESSLFYAISELNVNQDHITKVIECDERGQEFDIGDRQLTIPDVSDSILFETKDYETVLIKVGESNISIKTTKRNGTFNTLYIEEGQQLFDYLKKYYH